MSSTLTAAPAFTAEGFEAFLSTRTGEPDWLTRSRREAFEFSESIGWPLKRSEEWIRTDIRAFKLEKFTPPAEPTTTESVPDVHQLRRGIEPVGTIETLDSAIASESLDRSLAARGVVFGSLDRLCHEQPELVQKYLSTLFNAKHDRFAALHAAFWSGGQFLYVPRHVTVAEPLYIGSVMSDGGVDTSHTLIVLDEGAEATVIHECNSVAPSAGGLHLGAVELIQGAESNLRYVNVQEWGHKAYHFAQQKGAVGRDANLQWTIAAMGSGLTKVNQSVDLVGKGAYSQVNGVMFTEGRQHLSYHTEQRHVAPSCRSDFLYKSAQQDQSRTVWRGMIKVDKDAQKTDGYQRNDNLVLSDRARADSIPGLEIEADDVRCTHGSTTAKVDEEQIFYAMCRGLTRKEATRMIVSGFFQQIFDRITIRSVREAMATSIARQVREVA